MVIFSSYAFVLVIFHLVVDFGTPGRPDYFGLRPSQANYIKPGKKPLSSMSPILVFRKDGNATDSRMGKIVLGLGASGTCQERTPVWMLPCDHLPALRNNIHRRTKDNFSGASSISELCICGDGLVCEYG